MKPAWLGAGVLEPERVRVPLSEEYSDPAVPPPPSLRSTDERFRLKALLTLNLLNAEKVLPELSTDISTDAGVGADDAR